MIKNRSSWAPIRNLIIVLSSGVICALLFAFFMLYYYGPTGRYLLSNTLLSPETITSLSFEDPDKPGSGALRYQFDRIEYTFWDSEKKQLGRVQVYPANYSHFYQSIAQEKSILEVPDAIVKEFYTSKPSRITIFVKTSGKNPSLSEPSGKPIQTLEFSDGDYYRVELRGPQGSGGWVYFYHPGILNDFQNSFLGKK